jgi:hypothetical protein
VCCGDESNVSPNRISGAESNMSPSGNLVHLIHAMGLSELLRSIVFLIASLVGRWLKQFVSERILSDAVRVFSQEAWLTTVNSVPVDESPGTEQPVPLDRRRSCDQG